MKIKSFLLAVFTGCFLLLSFQSEAQKSNILIEKGLAYLSTSQSSTKGYNPEVGVSIDPENLYQMSKTPGDWGGAGISALCLQAFLQDGHNIDDPLYATTVQNGIDYILGRQVTDPGNYHYGAFGASGSYGYETAMCIFTLQLALETPLAGGGFISGTLRTEIEDAVAAGLNYYTQDINEAWSAVSWRYNRGYTGEYSGDMSVNQWVFLALDALDYTDKGVWTKIYNHMQGRKCSSGDYSYIGYQTCGTRAQGMTCAGIWGAVLTGSHGVTGASGLKTEFLNYLENLSLSQLIDLSSIGSSQIYVGGGYYYYLYGFSKALALSNKTNISGGNWYNYLYTTIESLHKTDANTNYYWDDWGGSGANMETALALLALQTQEVPVGSTLKVSLNTNPGGPKSDCFEFMVFDELGNEAGFNGTNWFSNIPL